MSLNLLRALLRCVEPRSAAPAGDEPGLRFVIELKAPADVDRTRKQLETALQANNFALEPSSAKPTINTQSLLFSVPGTETEIAPQVLSDLATSLAKELGAVSVEPDLPVRPGRSPRHSIWPSDSAEAHTADAALRALASSARGDGRESTGQSLSPRHAADVLKAKGNDVIERALGALDDSRAQDGALAADTRAIQSLLTENSREAVNRLATSGNIRGMSPTQRVSLEALIALTGRPAIPIRKDFIDFSDPHLGDWQAALLLLKKEIPTLTRSVGRIDLNTDHIGTGFLIADDLVMTNRHVLEELATPLPRAKRPSEWVLHDAEITIDFRREIGSTETLKFSIVGVEFAGADPTNGPVNFNDLDLAVLRIARTNSNAQKPPPPLSFLKGELGSHSSQDLLVIGFPARPNSLPTHADGTLRQEVVDALTRIFGLRYGIKYLSPGTVSAQPGAIRSDKRRWAFAHDATTLGGNSGSCVLRYGPTPAVIGLHFAGELERANYAHAAVRFASNKYLPSALLERLTWVEEL